MDGCIVSSDQLLHYSAAVSGGRTWKCCRDVAAGWIVRDTDARLCGRLVAVEGEILQLSSRGSGKFLAVPIP